MTPPTPHVARARDATVTLAVGRRGRQHAIRGFALLALAVVGLGACRSERPPTYAEWRTTWEHVQAVVPAQEELRHPVGDDTCQAVLGELRARRGALTPAPDEVVHEAADAWVTHAEHLFFECFGSDDQAARIAEGYATLDRLREEVEATLAEP